jgi:hypothetical protein
MAKLNQMTSEQLEDIKKIIETKCRVPETFSSRNHGDRTPGTPGTPGTKERPHVTIRYYPAYLVNATHGITVSDFTDPATQKNIMNHCRDHGIMTSANYREYGYLDTYVRIQQDNKSRLYFRKELHMFCSKKITGLFVIEIYNICTEDEFPYLAKYQESVQYNITSYEFETFRIRYTKSNNILDPDNKIAPYIDISTDLSLDQYQYKYNFNQLVAAFITNIINLQKQLQF